MTQTRLSLVQRQLLDTHMDILATPPDELSFLHTVSCQCALPARRPLLRRAVSESELEFKLAGKKAS